MAAVSVENLKTFPELKLERLFQTRRNQLNKVRIVRSDVTLRVSSNQASQL
jgi:hypothetical protein